MILTFGKYKNQCMSDLPTEYVVWLAMYELTDQVFFLSDDDAFEFTKAQHYIWGRQFKAVICARAEMKRRRICYDCLKPLVKIGHARNNGANHEDWTTRRLHKKCWKAL